MLNTIGLKLWWLNAVFWLCNTHIKLCCSYVLGDIMGPAMNNLNNLVKMPYGCGEQNMLNFAPNIFVMNYLKATGRSEPDLEEKAVSFMEQGK